MGLAKGIIAGLILGVSLVIHDKQGRVKKDFFAFGLGNTMFEKVLLIIALVPLKLGTAEEDFVRIRHC